MSISTNSPHRSHAPDSWESLPRLLKTAAVRALAAAGLVALVLSGVLLVRSASRDEIVSTPGALAAWAGLLLIAAVVGMYLILQRHWSPRPRWMGAWSAWGLPAACGVVLVAGLAAISIPAAGWARWVIWLTAIGSSTAVAVRSGAATPPMGNGSVDDEQPTNALAVPDLAPVAAAGDPEQLPGELDYRLERRRLDSGELQLSIWQCVTFAPWQHRETLHFPFWPPLTKPEVSGETIADCEAALRIQQVETHGCRVLVELEEADERPQRVEVELSVIDAPSPSTD